MVEPGSVASFLALPFMQRALLGGLLTGALGGVLDLVDSLLFAAPVAWLLWAAGR